MSEISQLGTLVAAGEIFGFARLIAEGLKASVIEKGTRILTILIDGHNLIGQMADLSLSDPHDEDELLGRLRAYRARTGKRLTVFFDPGDTYHSPKRVSGGGIIVRRAGQGQQADDLIVQDVVRHPNPRELTVVSSDHGIQDAVRPYGCRVLDSPAFAVEMAGSRRRKSRRQRRNRPETGPSLPADEVQDWLKLFGQSEG